MFVRRTTIRWALMLASGLMLTWPFFTTNGLKAQAVPALTIISPTDGTTVDGPVTVRVEHGGIVFDGVKIGQAPEPGVGHWHVNVDGQYAGLAVSNVLEIPNDAFPTISAGEHTITVDLHQNNHAATDPPVAQTIRLNFSKDVTIAPAPGGPPSIKLIEPAGGADAGTPIVVRIEHSGIVFDGVKIGQAPEPGVGHWHVNVDGQYAGLAVSNVLEIPNDAFPTISAGEHTITVDLHQNNHAATDPLVIETFQINVSQELSAGASGAAVGITAPGAATNAAGGRATMPNTGGSGADGMLIILAALVLMLIGLLVVYVNGHSRTRARSGR